MIRRMTLHGPFLVALVATAATLATLAPDGWGPGVTCDEICLIDQGKQLVAAMRHQGWAFFTPSNVEQNFCWPPDGPPVQAPLGYVILGLSHALLDPAPDNPDVVSVAAARFAPAMAFGLLILLVGRWTARREGPVAGTMAAAAVALMPRTFAHAHLAALDMLTALFFVAAVFAATEAVRLGRRWVYVLAGVAWGATLLIRLHGLLIVPPVAVWLVWRLRRRAVVPLVCWLASGAATFFVGWPWLWTDPASRLWQYLATGPWRPSLHVFYFGQAWADRAVPWHYPWVLFAVTVPVGFLALGVFGMWKFFHEKSANGQSPAFHSDLLCPCSALLFVLLMFSWPGVPVYDGVRLFLMVFPLWAIWVGVGVGRLIGRSWWWNSALAGFVVLQGVGLAAYFPCQLSYYNALVGGLPGAVQLGFEATYWGDTVREPMLAEAARRASGGPVFFAPSLAPYQPAGVTLNSRSLQQSGSMLIGWKLESATTLPRCRYAIVYHRRADMAEVEALLRMGRVVAEYRMQGVWLSRLVELAPR